MPYAVAWAVWLGRFWVSLYLLLKLKDTNLRGLGRSLGDLVGSISGVPLLLLKLKDTNLRALGCSLGGLVRSFLGAPLLLLKLKDTNLNGPGCGLGGLVDRIGKPLFCSLN